MCNYPIRILPKKQYVRRINVDDLNEKCQHLYLSRRLDVEENPFHYIGGRKLLNEGVINDDVLDWSTNLLGGKFRTEDIYWRQKEKGITEWNKEDINLDDYQGCYERIASANSVFIAINCLNKKTIPYKRKFGSRSDMQQYAEKTHEIAKDVIGQWKADDEFECHATITVEHKPIMLNYWHMTIGITPRDFEEPIPRDSKKNRSIKKRVKEALHLHIVKNIKCENVEIEKIPDNLYQEL